MLKPVFSLQDPSDHHCRPVDISTAAADACLTGNPSRRGTEHPGEGDPALHRGLDWMISSGPLLFRATLQTKQQPLHGSLAAACSPGQWLRHHRGNDRAVSLHLQTCPTARRVLLGRWINVLIASAPAAHLI